ncbi:DUF3883 domain-containing protein [Pontibacter fetidus]|uniref:DUF3883 domain-containing protein n=1 Tax=Pontibacter fetidus TaxID=2700082 RepID=A0A6B2HA32_9BACT|nr:DUF3883 domain-containing protein [Pontibacter fetidus]NDK57687.1 DUF3883 domain-containing protein [Pontibacter fetidus]
MDSNKLAIIVSYYLSKFDKEGLANIGYTTFSEALQDISVKLNVKRNYIKFRRDEFDPVHPWRKGWVRPMNKRLINIIEAFQDVSEPDLRGIVLDILNNKKEINDTLLPIVTPPKIEKGVKKYILRGPTGKLAEDYFIDNFTNLGLPINGEIIDTRDLGCGYDFEIRSDTKSLFIEVKGLSAISGGILLTNKEWKTALEKKHNYIIVIIKNLDANPEIQLIFNPAANLNPSRRILTTVQIQWTVPEKDIKHIS